MIKWDLAHGCKNDMVLCIENPKDTIKKLQEFINEFDKVAGHKINIQKSCIYTLMTKYKEEKLRKQSHLPLYQKE